MSNDSTPRARNARSKAQSHFEVADARTALVKQIVDAESKARDVRTVKLRALRLAKEEADRAEALANPKPLAPVRAKRRSAH